MYGRPTWTYFDEVGDYFVPNVCSPRDLLARPDNMDETVPHTHKNMIETLQISVSPEPLHRFKEACYVSFGTSACHSLFKC